MAGVKEQGKLHKESVQKFNIFGCSVAITRLGEGRNETYEMEVQLPSGKLSVPRDDLPALIGVLQSSESWIKDDKHRRALSRLKAPRSPKHK